jgi:hypothetical protein
LTTGNSYLASIAEDMGGAVKAIGRHPVQKEKFTGYAGRRL